MDIIAPMPDREKFQHVLEMVRLYQKHVLPYIEQHLGYAEMHNLRAIWRAAMNPIHENDPDLEKYNLAYSNWLWMARCCHDLIAEKMSGDEVFDYKRLILSLYVKRLNNPDLFILRAIGAHTSIARALLYEMQWITPLEIMHVSKEKVTCEVADCRLLLTPGVERVCRVDCQNVGAAYARKAYHLRRITSRSHHGCTITLTPLSAEQD